MSVSEKKKQELYLELKSLDEEIKNLNMHLDNIDAQLNELNSSKDIVNKISELKKGEEIRMPVTSGIYVKAKLDDTSKLMVNVGGNVTVEKTPKEVTKILDSQVQELAKYREQIVDQLKVFIIRIEEIQKEIE